MRDIDSTIRAGAGAGALVVFSGIAGALFSGGKTTVLLVATAVLLLLVVAALWPAWVVDRLPGRTARERERRLDVADQLEDAMELLSGMLRRRAAQTSGPQPGPENRWGRGGVCDGNAQERSETVGEYHERVRGAMLRAHRRTVRIGVGKPGDRGLITKAGTTQDLWRLMNRMNKTLRSLRADPDQHVS